MSANNGFSARSVGSPYPRQLGNGGNAPPVDPISAVTVNASLLTPVDLQLDPELQGVRNKEKEDIKGLNDRFASFIDKVRVLEQKNKVLETKWKLLQRESRPESKLEPMLKSYIGSLQEQLEQGDKTKRHLDAELRNVLAQVEDQKQRYEDEINNRTKAENDFVLLKTEVDKVYLNKIALEEKIPEILGDLNFFKRFYEQELRELKADMKDTSVVVQMDNRRTLDMEKIISEVKSQYEEISASNRKEAEAWYKDKFDTMSSQADQCNTELKDNTGAIADLKRKIKRLQTELTSAKSQCERLEGQIDEAERCGEDAVLDAKKQIRSLQDALQRAKQEMTKQIHDYQELMNVKLALDIEIATYRKLLEGEESRLEQDSNFHPVYRR